MHLIDTPGYPDFAGQATAALAGVDTAVVVVNAQTGVELSTERMMRAAAARGLARMIVINKIDADNVDLPGLVADIRDRFGKQCLLLDLPAHDRHDVVEVLEEGLAEAQRRPVLAVAVVLQLPGGVVSTAYAIRGGDGAHLTHALSCLHARLTSPDLADEEEA